MYFMLGKIAFEPVNVTEFSETHAAEFAEHAVLRGKPRLQAMGEKLNELSFAIRLHHKIGGVESRYQTLLEAKAKQEALPLIWGTRYRGDYVITDIESTTLFTDKLGNALAREMTISLKEFVGDSQTSPLGEALNIGSSSLLGAIFPESAVKTLSQAKEVVSKTATAFNSGKRLLDEMRGTLSLVKDVINDPSTALAYLPSVLGNLEGALGNFGEVTGLSEDLANIGKWLPVTAEVSRTAGEIFANLQTIQQVFTDADNGGGWENWYTPVVNNLSTIEDKITNANKSLSEMTVWFVLRNDEGVAAEEDDDGSNTD